MHNIEAYKTDLLIYLITILIVAAAIFAAGNALLLILKFTKVFSERKVWILANLVGVAILLACITPVCLDITQSSVCEVCDVVKIEVDKNKYGEYVLLTDSSGQTYSCRDYLVEENALSQTEYPVVAVFAKHSKLLLEIYNPITLE